MTDENQNGPKENKRRRSRDVFILLASLGAYILLFSFVKRDHLSSYLSSFDSGNESESSIQTQGASSGGADADEPEDGSNLSDKETAALNLLENTAKNSSWQDLEEKRSQMAQNFTQSNFHPSDGMALYFFPETLSQSALETDFSEHELKPGLKKLREAYERGNTKEAESAYTLLKSRVENFELGATEDPSSLSFEALKFLSIYGNFSKGK